MNKKNKHLAKRNRKTKKVRNHLTFEQKGCFGSAFNNCLNKFDYFEFNLRSNRCNRHCKKCSKSLCRKHSGKYKKEVSNKLSKPTYVCGNYDIKFKYTFSPTDGTILEREIN